MGRLLFHQLGKRKGRFILTVLLLTILIISISFALSTLQFADRTVQLEINDFARGSYDLLVRPADASSELEEKIGIVEENYLGIGEGGISLAEWKDILSMDEVDTAAPVAALGFFTSSQLTFKLPLIEEPVRYTVLFETSDGLKDYKVKEYVAYSFPHSEADYDGRDTVITSELINVFTSLEQSFLLPAAYHPLVAVDPDEEEKLTSIKYTSLKEEHLYHDYIDAEVIPIINIKETFYPIVGKLTIEKLNITNDETVELFQNGRDMIGIDDSQPLFSWNDEQPYLDFFVSLSDIEVKAQEEHVLDFSEQLSAMNDVHFFVDENYNILTREEWDPYKHGDLSVIIYYDSQDVFYQLSDLKYTIASDQIAVLQVAEYENGLPIYRETTKVKWQDSENYSEDTTDAFFKSVGEISVSENENTLAASPLGIYNYEETTYQGKTV
ncbi:hypothetical protein SAMN05421736_1211, partial [Evansella caseinilytica]